MVNTAPAQFNPEDISMIEIETERLTKKSCALIADGRLQFTAVGQKAESDTFVIYLKDELGLR